MNGCAIPAGERLHITPFDLAVYADMGYPLANLFGDYNIDGAVDAADYVIWRKLLGTTHTPAYYNVWHSSFGSTAAPGRVAPSPLPELPTSMLLTWVTIFASSYRSRTVRNINSCGGAVASWIESEDASY
jgi:hypothetical protein